MNEVLYEISADSLLVAPDEGNESAESHIEVSDSKRKLYKTCKVEIEAWLEIPNDEEHVNEVRFRLMQIFKRSLILWNSTHPRYGEIEPTRRAWKELAVLTKIQEMTAAEARREVDILRKQYAELCINPSQEDINETWVKLARSIWKKPDPRKLNLIEKRKHSSKAGIVSLEQHNLLFELIKENFQITKDHRLNRNYSILIPTGAKSPQAIWNEIALKCNAVGPPKTVFQWKKCWHRKTLQTREIVEKIHRFNNSNGTFDPFDLNLYPSKVKKIIEFCGLQYFLRETSKLNQIYVIEPNAEESSLLEDIKQTESFVEVKVEAPPNTCRACLQLFLPEDDHLHSLDYTYVDEIVLREIYKELVGCNTPENESLLPAFICVDCENFLLGFREFLGKCHSNEAHLLNMAKQRTDDSATKTELETLDAEIMVDPNYMLPDDFFLDFNEDYETKEVEVVTENDPELLRVDVENTNNLDFQANAEITTDNEPIVPREDIKETNRYKCSECDRLFSLRCNLYRHLRGFHKLPNDFVEQLKQKQIIISPESYAKNFHQQAKFFKCGDCGREFTRSSDLVIHFRIFHKLADDVVQRLQEEIQQSKPKKKKKSSSVCPICGKIVRTLQLHLDRHQIADPPRYHCILCKKNYASKNTLSIHMQTKHLGQRIQCPFCPKTFKSTSGRVSHIHMQHYKPKDTLECHICDKKFPSELTFRRHQRLHRAQTKKKKFQCDICSQICSTQWTLNVHIESKHSNKKYPCQQCGRVIKNKRQFKRHLEYHKGEKNYECPVCLQLFGQNFVLRLHVEKKHPGHVLPPKGTILNKKALEEMARQRELEQQYEKMDFTEKV